MWGHVTAVLRPTWSLLELPGGPPGSDHDGRCTCAAKDMSTLQQHSGHCCLMKRNSPEPVLPWWLQAGWQEAAEQAQALIAAAPWVHPAAAQAWGTAQRLGAVFPRS